MAEGNPRNISLEMGGGPGPCLASDKGSVLSGHPFSLP